MTDNFLTAEEVSKILKIHKETVYKYVKLGKLKPFRVGSALRFTQEQINAYNSLAQSDYLEMNKSKLDYDWCWDTLFFGRDRWCREGDQAG